MMTQTLFFLFILLTSKGIYCMCGSLIKLESISLQSTCGARRFATTPQIHHISGDRNRWLLASNIDATASETHTNATYNTWPWLTGRFTYHRHILCSSRINLRCVNAQWARGYSWLPTSHSIPSNIPCVLMQGVRLFFTRMIHLTFLAALWNLKC